MDDNKSKKIAHLLSGKRAVILIHHNADADAVGSAIALREEFLGKICPGVEIAAPQCLTRGASRLSQGLGVPITIDLPLQGFEATVIVDTLSPEQLAPYRLSDMPRPIVAIDHHYDREELRREAAVYITMNRPSCAEVVLSILRDYYGVSQIISEKSRLAILAAVIADTQHLSRAGIDTLRDIVSLNPSNGDIEKARELISVQPDISEKIACLKAMKCVEFERLGPRGETLLARCIAGSFESTVANVLLKAGADIGIVAAEKDKGNFVRISGRSRCRGIHLGKDVFEPLGNMFGGSGGGHAAAASANIKQVSATEGLKSCTNLIRKLLCCGGLDK